LFVSEMLKDRAFRDPGLARNVLGTRILVAVLGEVPHGHVHDVRSLGWYGLAFRSIHRCSPLQEYVYAPEGRSPKPASIVPSI
jgi:hypothetical protein